MFGLTPEQREKLNIMGSKQRSLSKIRAKLALRSSPVGAVFEAASSIAADGGKESGKVGGKGSGEGGAEGGGGGGSGSYAASSLADLPSLGLPAAAEVQPHQPRAPGEQEPGRGNGRRGGGVPLTASAATAGSSGNSGNINSMSIPKVRTPRGLGGPGGAGSALNAAVAADVAALRRMAEDGRAAAAVSEANMARQIAALDAKLEAVVMKFAVGKEADGGGRGDDVAAAGRTFAQDVATQRDFQGSNF